MTTYNTYPEAQIDNHEAVIYEFEGKFSLFKGVGSVECNPSDHCSTLADFLAAGYELVRDDWVLGLDGNASTVTSPTFMNIRLEDDKNRFILSAKALNGGSKIPEKKESEVKESAEPRYKYVKVDSLECLNEDYKLGSLFYKTAGVSGFLKVEGFEIFGKTLLEGRLYRRVEMTERELFCEKAKEILGCGYCDGEIGQLYDAGCRFNG